mmetsp:Transcript_38400/g.78720  ORF Transcript_38400/g.78720 Transcript_38400/m.78720 type:complete len:242 (-) Transcript_38400:467-1192(-)
MPSAPAVNASLSVFVAVNPIITAGISSAASLQASGSSQPMLSSFWPSVLVMSTAPAPSADARETLWKKEHVPRSIITIFPLTSFCGLESPHASPPQLVSSIVLGPPFFTTKSWIDVTHWSPSLPWMTPECVAPSTVHSASMDDSILPHDATACMSTPNPPSSSSTGQSGNCEMSHSAGSGSVTKCRRSCTRSYPSASSQSAWSFSTSCPPSADVVAKTRWAFSGRALNAISREESNHSLLH